MTTKFDYKRRERIGLPECVYCESKSVVHLNRLIDELIKKARHPVLLTRLSEQKLAALSPRLCEKMNYDALSGTAFIHGVFPKRPRFSVAVVTAGTSDLAVAGEACRTLEYLGIVHKLYSDIGVAGLWRLQERIGEINKADLVIVAAGMDAALASVLGGLTPKPLIAVPTSVGYGVAKGGATALNSMLSSCAPGIVVTNIDNGYGAACAAFRILGIRKKK